MLVASSTTTSSGAVHSAGLGPLQQAVKVVFGNARKRHMLHDKLLGGWVQDCCLMVCPSPPGQSR